MPEPSMDIARPSGLSARPGQDPAYDLFISYAADDHTWVEGYLQDALDAAGVKVHSQAAFALGAPRLLEFERAVMQCKRILLVLSPAYMADQFGGFLDIMAQNFGLESGTWPLIPLVLKPTPLPPRLSQLVTLNATDIDDWHEAVERLCESLNYPIPGPPPLPDCPYPGMLPFSMEQSDQFYGRDQEIEEILQRLRLHPFLMVIGPSGSGKSSLVFAGVIPALHRNASLGAGTWHVHTFRPGSTPRANLRAAPPQTETRQLLDQVFAEISDSSPGTATSNTVASNKVASKTLAPNTQSPPSPRRLLVIVDQYEELFTNAPTPDAPKDPTDGEEAADPKTTEIALFQQDLLRLAARPDCYVIATVRADFYADLMASALWPQIQAHRMEVPPMSPANLRQAIMQPAETLGVYIQSDLVEQLLTDGAGEPGALPLIQETLVLLWQRIQRRYLSLHAYESLVLGRKEYGESGQVSGLQVAMARRADAALAALSAPEREVARRILLRMIQFGQGRKDTRRQQFSYDLQSENDDPRIFQRTLQHLVDHRLLTLTGEAGAIAKKVDIAHEALISGWPTLGRWIHQRRDGEVVRRRLEQQAQEWQRLGQKSGGLLDEVQLLEAERWMAGPGGKDAGFSGLLQELAQRSREAVDAAALAAEQARQEKVLAAQKLAEEAQRREAVEAKAAKRMRRLSAVMAVIALITVGLAFRAIYLRNQADLARMAADRAQAETLVAYDIAEAARVTNEAHLLASQAVQSMQYDPETAISLAWTALTTDRDSVTENTLRRVLLSTYRSTTLEGHSGSVRGLAASPDGSRLVSAGYDGTLRIWSTDSEQTLTVLSGAEDRLRGVAWSEDGRWVAGGGLDGKIYLWDVSAIFSPTLQPDRILAGHDGWVYGLAFSPDGRWLASSGQDGMVILWNLVSGQPFMSVDVDAGEVNDVTWSPSGDYLAFAADDQLVGVWPRTDLLALGPGVHKAAAPIRLEGHRSYVLSVDFSPDGAWLASSSADSSVRIWNMQTRASSDMLIDKDGTWIYDVNWSPDGSTLASAAGDNLVRVWDVGTGKILRVLTGHKDWVTAAVWAGAKSGGKGGGGQTVASASMDGSVRLWQIGVHPSIQVYPAHDSALVAVDWNPGGHWIITAGGDGLLRVWEASGQLANTAVFTQENGLRDVAWAPGGERFAFSDTAGNLGLWERGQVQTVAGAAERIAQLAWRPDGLALVTVSWDGNAAIWESASLTTTAQFAVADSAVGAQSVAWSPDGRTIAVGDRAGTVTLWDAQDHTQIQAIPAHAGIVWGLDWDRESRFVGSASQDGLVKIWDTQNLAPAGGEIIPAAILRHESGVNDLSWSHDGTRLATASDDATVQIWDAQTFLPTTTFTGPPGPVKGFWKLSWSPDNLRLAASAADGSLMVFQADFDVLLDYVKAQNVPLLSPEQRAMFTGR